MQIQAKLLWILAGVILIIAGVAVFFVANPEWTFSKIVREVEKRHSAPQISSDALAAVLQSAEKDQYLLFDTRLKEEHFVGHIQGSLRVDEDMTAGEFIEKYADNIRGKHLVFYCSVGYRSSIFLNRVEDAAREAGASSLANLTGGVFQWFNDGRAVYDRKGETDIIHPYGRIWAFLLKDR